MSAIADDGPSKPIEVLFAVHDDFDTLDVLGPLEIFHHAKQEAGEYRCFRLHLSSQSQPSSLEEHVKHPNTH